MTTPSGKQLPSICSELPGERVMVIAPHMDDEVIGCGGTLVKYRQQDVPCSVTFLMAERIRPARRWQEARAALTVLGIQEHYSLDVPPRETPVAQDIPERLGDIYRESPFDILFVPTIGDWHPDHQLANRVIGDFLKACSPDPVQILGYEIWDHPFPDVLVDISGHFDTKTRALACYESQLATFNYQKMMAGMASMRAAFFRRGSTHAEAFQDYGDAGRFQRELERFESGHG